MVKFRREYRLSKAGRRKLRRTIRRTKPWQRSTGPRTGMGKRRSAANAIRVGDYVQNPDIVQIENKPIATFRLCMAMLRYDKAYLYHMLLHDKRSPDRMLRAILDMEKWSRRLVALGDDGCGFGRGMLGFVNRWWENINQQLAVESNQLNTSRNGV